MKIDPYKHKEMYLAWKKGCENGIQGISKENFTIILQHFSDMEVGLNVATKSVKGSRSYIRINTLKDKMLFFARNFSKLYPLQCFTEISEDKLIKFFLSNSFVSCFR